MYGPGQGRTVGKQQTKDCSKRSSTEQATCTLKTTVVGQSTGASKTSGVERTTGSSKTSTAQQSSGLKVPLKSQRTYRHLYYNPQMKQFAKNLFKHGREAATKVEQKNFVYRCVLCNEVFQHSSILVDHCTKKHKGGGIKYSCVKCGFCSKDIKAFMLHAQFCKCSCTKKWDQRDVHLVRKILKSKLDDSEGHAYVCGFITVIQMSYVKSSLTGLPRDIKWLPTLIVRLCTRLYTFFHMVVISVNMCCDLC